MLKHVIWEKSDGKGRIGIRVDNDHRIEMKQLSGGALSANMLLPVLQSVLGDNWIAEAEQLHQNRAYPWCVEEHQGMSGARNYRLRFPENEEWRNAPVSAYLHVSMNDKLNQGLKLWLGDLPPLLTELVEDYPPPEEDLYRLQVYEPEEPAGFNEPGTSSGFQEILESLKAMDVLTK